jgi:DNA-binding PadR family transcriptional regulator
MNYMARDGQLELGLWELAVLCSLREQPMHPYEVQRVLSERKKDEVLALKKGSLYHAISRLQRAELIEPLETSRSGRRPERTTYRITEAGEAALTRSLREFIAQLRPEPSQFTASLSFLVYLQPAQAAVELEARTTELEQQIASFDVALRVLTPRIGRINVIETEYARAMRQAELAWVRHILEDLRAKRFTWDLDAILEAVRAARAGAPPTPSATTLEQRRPHRSSRRK